jgi:peptidoglycan/LPS O-acetylase OafA/YrhL
MFLNKTIPEVGRKNNNFDLIRLISAIFVVYSHSFLLTGSRDIIENITRIRLSTVGVDIFFVASGFLITCSFLRSKSISFFVSRRILRIYPALIVCCVLTVLVFGPIFTELSIAEYFSSSLVYKYLFGKSTIVGVVFTGGGTFLPGVFYENPYPGVVNGSLWTLLYEVIMYLFVVCFGFLGLRFFRRSGSAHTALYLLLLLFCFVLKIDFHFESAGVAHNVEAFSRFGICFACGGLLYIYRKKVILTKYLALMSVAAILLQRFYIDVSTPLYPFCLAYLVVFAAFSRPFRGGFINFRNDYSYGIYIYAFPIQQAIIWFYSDINPIALFALSIFLVIPLAMLSWHLVEKRFLKFKFVKKNRSFKKAV